MKLRTDAAETSTTVNVDTALTFDDVLLVPHHSQVLPSCRRRLDATES